MRERERERESFRELREGEREILTFGFGPLVSEREGRGKKRARNCGRKEVSTKLPIQRI